MHRDRVPRAYDMQSRREAASATRRRIVDAAHGLLARPDSGALELVEVARAAGVSRATIYNSIGSRADLLAAVFVDQGRVIGFERVLGAMALEDPARALVATVRESCRAWSVEPDAIRRTLALAVIDPEVGRLVDRYEGDRRERMAALARRARRAGVTAPALSARDVTATLTLLTSFQAFDHHLVDGDAEAATRRLTGTARRALGLVPAGGRSR